MATPLTNEQLDLCRRLHDQLVAHGPEHFDMCSWLTNEYVSGEQLFGRNIHGLNDIIGVDRALIHECGTVACIAGHTMLLLTDDERTDLTKDVKDVKSWYLHNGIERNLAERLGILVDLPAGRMHRALFMSDWPAYMRDFRDARYTRHTSASDISTHTSTAWARAEFDTVVWVLDDLTHGVRQNWWDGKILAAEEEMEIAERELQQQLDDEADPDYVDHDHDREF